MASGDNLTQSMGHIMLDPPASVAYMDHVIGGGTPASERFPVVVFVDGAVNYYGFSFYMPSALTAAASIRFDLPWTCSVTTNNATIGIATRPIVYGTTNLTAAHTYTFVDVNDPPAGTVGIPKLTSVTLTSAQHGLSASQSYAIVIRRQGNTDPMNGALELHWPWLQVFEV